MYVYNLIDFAAKGEEEEEEASSPSPWGGVRGEAEGGE